MIRKLVLFTITIVFLLCPKAQASQHSVTNVKESIVKHSIELGIDPALALSIAKSESGFRHEARSSGGAVGVFQLMPSTARRLGVDPYCLSGNIKGGLMYYKKMYTMFGSTELALAAYNAGPGTVKKYKRVPPIGETKRFVSNIMTEYNRQKKNPDPAITKVKTTKTTTTNAKNSIKTIDTAAIKALETARLKPTAPVPAQGIV
jgi:soluble lytic murein transglycosylase-like protein